MQPPPREVHSKLGRVTDAALDESTLELVLGAASLGATEQFRPHCRHPG